MILFIGIHFCQAQQTAIELSTAMLDTSHQVFIANRDGWLFKEGHDAEWARADIDLSGWRKFKPTELSAANVDKSGKMEGWFRLKIRLESTFNNMPLGLMLGSWASSDLYVNGQFVQSFGSTGAYGKPYKEDNPYQRLPVSVALEPNKEHIIAIHLVDYVSWFPWPKQLKSEYGQFDFPQNSERIISITTPGYNALSLRGGLLNSASAIVILSINSTFCLLFWLLLFLNPLEKNLRILTAFCTFITAFSYFGYQYSTFSFQFAFHMLFGSLWGLFMWLAIGTLPIIFYQILLSKVHRSLRYLFAVTVILSLVYGLTSNFNGHNYSFSFQLMGIFILIDILLSAWSIILTLKTIHGAQWSIVVGLIIAALSGILWMFSVGKDNNITGDIVMVSFPLALILYVAIRFKEILRDVRENAKQVILISEEKRELLASQNETLEKQVMDRTKELSRSLNELKETQGQLIQQEKMASLGQLTAGIAHEIQNPLNFVNNFSEVNNELLIELEEEADKGNIDEVKAITKDIKENGQKINHHGKRADAIVKGMLEHSKTSTGKKEPTDINKLADEYLRLSYHGFRAKDKSFNSEIKTEFDETIGKINIIPQDIGRVLLNLFNNAFYAVNEKVTAHCSPLITTHL
jgi:two-component system NtrC family sensor kinase